MFGETLLSHLATNQKRSVGAERIQNPSDREREIERIRIIISEMASGAVTEELCRQFLYAEMAIGTSNPPDIEQCVSSFLEYSVQSATALIFDAYLDLIETDINSELLGKIIEKTLNERIASIAGAIKFNDAQSTTDQNTAVIKLQLQLLTYRFLRSQLTDIMSKLTSTVNWNKLLTTHKALPEHPPQKQYLPQKAAQLPSTIFKQRRGYRNHDHD